MSFLDRVQFELGTNHLLYKRFGKYPQVSFIFVPVNPGDIGIVSTVCLVKLKEFPIDSKCTTYESHVICLFRSYEIYHYRPRRHFGTSNGRSFQVGLEKTSRNRPATKINFFLGPRGKQVMTRALGNEGNVSLWWRHAHTDHVEQ